MVHVLILRSCPSFTQPRKDGLVWQGVHEEIELAIERRKYPLTTKDGFFRDGYAIISPSEWHFMEYRVKKEAAPFFIRDLSVINLNPKTNKMTLYKILFKKNIHENQQASVGRLIQIIQWLFKWFNRFNKFPIYVIRTIKAIFNILTFKFSRLKNTYKDVRGVIPLMPMDVADVGQNYENVVPFTKCWHYDFFIGVLPDITRHMGEEL